MRNIKKNLTIKDTDDLFKAVSDYLDITVETIDKYIKPEVKDKINLKIAIFTKGDSVIEFSTHGMGVTLGSIFEKKYPFSELKENKQSVINDYFDAVTVALNNGAHLQPSVNFNCNRLYTTSTLRDDIEVWPEYLSASGLEYHIAFDKYKNFKKTLKNPFYVDGGFHDEADNIIDWSSNVKLIDESNFNPTLNSGGSIFFNCPVPKRIMGPVFADLFKSALNDGSTFSKYNRDKTLNFLNTLKDYLSQDLIEDVCEKFIIKSNNLKNLQLLDSLEDIVGVNIKSNKFKEIGNLREARGNSIMEVADMSKCVIISPNSVNFSDFSYFVSGMEKKYDKSETPEALDMVTKMMLSSGLDSLGVDDTSVFKFPGGAKSLMLKVNDNFNFDNYHEYCKKSLKIIREVSKQVSLGSFASYAKDKESLGLFSFAVNKWILEERLSHVKADENDNNLDLETSFKM